MAVGSVVLLCCAILLIDVGAQDSELRGLWIATVENIDWPHASDSASQQTELIEYIQLMENHNLNAVMFQVRPMGDALYRSDLEPWSHWVTGVQGQAPDPYYDPLELIIEEAHARGIEVHAWLNPYRANNQPSLDGLAANHMANRFKEYAHEYGNLIWMDPASDEVLDHLLDVVKDLIKRYDIDAIHIDDYFYPYPIGELEFPDGTTYSRYQNSGGGLSKADWRRGNVNRMVQSLYDTTKGAGRPVKFGISPGGLIRPGHSDGMPLPIQGFDKYDELYADVRKWIENGWADYFAPQIYWEIDPPAQSYPLILDFWLRPDVNKHGRHIMAGNAIYKLNYNNFQWNTSEILRQIEISRARRSNGSVGNILYSARFFRNDTKGIATELKNGLYSAKVNVPEMPWMNSGGNTLTSNHLTTCLAAILASLLKYIYQ